MIYSYYLKLLFFIFSILIIISFFTLWERKLLAAIQRRQGPSYVGSFGILQAFADGLKLIFKEVNFNAGYYYYCYMFSSILSLVLSLLAWTVIPFNPSFIIANINMSVLFLLMISSLNVFTTLFSGWSSNTKYGLIGSIRSAAQMISYEIPLSLTLFPIFFISLSTNLHNIIIFQNNNYWFIIFSPLAFIFFVCSLAETNRTPFDLPEAESELIAGYNIEYSSIPFALFFLAEYNHILVMSAVFSALFLGGWSLNPCSFIFNYFQINIINIKVYSWLVNLLGVIISKPIAVINFCFNIFYTIIFLIKIFLIASLFVVVRATMPRYKYTQLIIMCWKTFIPFLCFFCLFIFSLCLI